MLGSMASRPTVSLRTETGLAVCERCVVADRPLARLRGLLGRRDLPAEEGLWIRPCASVHMLFMRFATDVLFLDRQDRVVRVVERLRPWRLASARGARSAIELRAGEAARRGVAVGDRVVASPAGP
jgi:uncharacterized membrane protein (UPF0127 family)